VMRDNSVIGRAFCGIEAYRTFLFPRQAGLGLSDSAVADLCNDLDSLDVFAIQKVSDRHREPSFQGIECRRSGDQSKTVWQVGAFGNPRKKPDGAPILTPDCDWQSSS